MQINQKFIEILHNLIVMQNIQLLKIIAEEENIPIKLLEDQFITSRSQFHNMMSHVNQNNKECNKQKEKRTENSSD